MLTCCRVGVGINETFGRLVSGFVANAIKLWVRNDAVGSGKAGMRLPEKPLVESIAEKPTKTTTLGDVAQCFGEFQTHIAQQNYGLAVDVFMRALDVAPGLAFRYFITRASLGLARAVGFTRRSAEVVAALDSRFADHPLMHLLSAEDPAQIERLIALREDNIAKGLPSVAMVTLGKSGSISVANIFNSGFNLPSFAYSLGMSEVIESFVRDFARGGACYSTHLEPKLANVQRLKAAGVEKIVVHVRDPRQSLLSMIHHVSKYPDQMPERIRRNLHEPSIRERMDDFLELYFWAIGFIQRWCDAEKELNILFSTFEEFVCDRTAFTKRYVAFYGHADRFSWHDALNFSGDTHFRLGRVDEWREVFPKKTAEFLTSVIPPAMLDRFNWTR